METKSPGMNHQNIEGLLTALEEINNKIFSGGLSQKTPGLKCENLPDNILGNIPDMIYMKNASGLSNIILNKAGGLS